MTGPAVNLGDVIAYHVGKAEAYTARATTWARYAEQLKTSEGRPNAVRRATLDGCAQQAADIAARHAAMADLLEALAPKPPRRWPRLIGWTLAAAASLALWQAIVNAGRSLSERGS